MVPARELSLKEVETIKKATQMEMECFVHGALCYCYSGQCLMSSLIGGRSGNRGQCAQPCRLPYTYKGKNGYLMSLKDICTLESIPDLIEHGIDSFKIEGRMKKPEYVAGVTAMYRKYTDLYLEHGREKFRVKKSDLEELMDLYNRGGFHSGYYFVHNGPEMLCTNRPNHAGTKAAKVLGQKGRELQISVLKDLIQRRCTGISVRTWRLYTWQRLEKRRKADDTASEKSAGKERRLDFSNQMQCVAATSESDVCKCKTSGADLRTCCSETW